MVPTRLFLAALFVCLPAVAWAQESDGPDSTPAGHARLTLNVPLPAGDTPLFAALQPARPPVGQPSPPPQRERRRRPSMVGYINDATIGSMLRVRFDAGFRVTAPDRGEFFYAKCGCYRDLPPSHPFYDPDAPGGGPAINTDIDFRQLYVMGEYAFNSRASVFAELPMRWVDVQAVVPGTGPLDKESGVSDIRFGMKASAVETGTQRLTVQFQAGAPSGDPAKGMGSDRWSLEPAAMYAAALNDRVMFESQVGGIFPTSGSAGLPTSSDRGFESKILYYGVGLSAAVVRTDSVDVAPVVELVGWKLFGGFQTTDFRDVDGLDIVNLKLGLRVSAGAGQSFYVGYGRRLTDAWWYEDLFRAEYRVAF